MAEPGQTFHSFACPPSLHLGVPCGFSKFFSISMATNVTAHDECVAPLTNIQYSQC